MACPLIVWWIGTLSPWSGMPDNFCSGRNLQSGSPKSRPYWHEMHLLKALPERKWLTSSPRARWIWIDALCIDQDNLVEKSSQVEMMGKIYQAAERVIVWLDDMRITHSQLTDAFFLLELISLCSIEPSTDLYDPPTRVIGLRNHWVALNKLLSHPYWHRVWIFQEIAMAKKLHLLYGNKYFDWDELVRMVAILLTYPMSVIPAVASQAYKLDVSTLLDGAGQIFLLSVVRNGVLRKEFNSFIECITMTQKCNATDPRDKIFALRNLVDQRKIPQNYGGVAADYKMSVQDVYLNCSRNLLGHEAHFILSMAGIGWQRKTAGLPSWVPDFRSLPWRIDECKIDAEARLRAGLPGALSISGGEMPNKPLSTVTVQAVAVSEISSLTMTSIDIGSNYNPADDMSMAKLLYQEASSIVDKLPSKYAATGQDIMEAFWRTIIEDRNVIEGDPVAKLRRPAALEYGFYFLVHFKEILVSGDDTFIGTSGKDDADETERREYHALKYRSSFNMVRSLSLVWRGRKFATTGSGLIGVVPFGAELGDILCVVPGFERPVLLRRKPRPKLQGDIDEESFEFVGTCYAHGIMDGEVLQEKPCIETFTVQ